MLTLVEHEEHLISSRPDVFMESVIGHGSNTTGFLFD